MVRFWGAGLWGDLSDTHIAVKGVGVQPSFFRLIDLSWWRWRQYRRCSKWPEYIMTHEFLSFHAWARNLLANKSSKPHPSSKVIFSSFLFWEIGEEAHGLKNKHGNFLGTLDLCRFYEKLCTYLTNISRTFVMEWSKMTTKHQSPQPNSQTDRQSSNLITFGQWPVILDPAPLQSPGAG